MTRKSTDGATRPYRSPLRERQSRRTREAILEAFAELVIENGVARATMAAVAERAGVAERTVYRHFANGRALLDGLSEQAHTVMQERGADAVDAAATDPAPSLADTLAHAASLYEGFEAAGKPMKAAIIAGLSEGYRSPSQPGRIEAIRRTLRAELPQLSEREIAEVLVMVRFQLGAQAWYLLTQQEGLSTAQAARLSARAVRTFVDSLREPSPAGSTPEASPVSPTREPQPVSPTRAK